MQSHEGNFGKGKLVKEDDPNQVPEATPINSLPQGRVDDGKSKNMTESWSWREDLMKMPVGFDW